MESKGSIRSGSKSDAKTASSGKSEKPSPGPVTIADKKETPKEQPAPVTTPAKKGVTATNDASSMLNDHNNLKPNPTTATEGPEAAAQSADSENKGNNAEEESQGNSIFENMKPLIIVGGVAVAAIAVIVGVAILARKK